MHTLLLWFTRTMGDLIARTPKNRFGIWLRRRWWLHCVKTIVRTSLAVCQLPANPEWDDGIFKPGRSYPMRAGGWAYVHTVGPNNVAGEVQGGWFPEGITLFWFWHKDGLFMDDGREHGTDLVPRENGHPDGFPAGKVMAKPWPTAGWR
jgi:hypothetical protein